MASVFFGISTRTYHYDRTLGRGDFSGAGFRNPADLALGPEGRIYVISRGWEYRPDTVRITIMTYEEDYLGQFSQGGEGPGEFIGATCIALDSAQNVYVTDEWLDRISVFDRDGDFLDHWGESGSGDGRLSKPAGIAFDADDNAYVVDGGNNRVQVFTKDGKFLAKWGEAGSGEGQFNLPWGVTVDARGDVYVADWRNDRVQKFSADGRFLAEFGETGDLVGQFNRPTDVAVDKDGDIYVADWRNDRVQVLSPDGRHVTTFTGDGGISKWAQEKLNANPDMIKQRAMIRDLEPERRLWRPKGLEIDDQGRIIIVDSNRDRLQVYQKDDY